jgi:FKBP-type peptidyl-prolyl cis-trans isomerase (trigger factor)
MKVELTDVSETKKTLTVEVPPDVVDSEISRITQGYARQARIPGFRPGKAPAHVVRKRFREQILHDVAHDRAWWATPCATSRCIPSIHPRCATSSSRKASR